MEEREGNVWGSPGLGRENVKILLPFHGGGGGGGGGLQPGGAGEGGLVSSLTQRDSGQDEGGGGARGLCSGRVGGSINKVK